MIPRLVAPEPRIPRLLEARVRELRRQHGRRDSGFLETDLTPARHIVAQLVELGVIVRPPTRRETRLLLHLFPELNEPEEQGALVRLVLAAKPSWRVLWHLWQQPSVGWEQVIDELSEALDRSRSRSDRAASHLPKWIPSGGLGQSLALLQPSGPLGQYVESEGIPLPDVARLTQLDPTSKLGETCLVALVAGGGRPWWLRQDSEAIRAWAGQHEGPILRAVADRLLVEAGRGCESPASLPEDPLLRRWVEELLGHPENAPGKWLGISERARQIYNWYYANEQFAKILDNFTREARDPDRARFWRRYHDQLVDAHFVAGLNSAICLLVIGQVVVCEFGTKGHASHVYQAPKIPLRSLAIPSRPRAEHFKSQRCLDFREIRSREPATMPFLTRLIHLGPWEAGFASTLEQYGARRPTS